MIVLAFLFSLLFIRRKPALSQVLNGSLIWMVGWLAVFLPWVIKVEYYLLPLALGCSIFSALLLEHIVISSRDGQVWHRVLIILIIVGGGVLLINTVLTNFENARFQLLMDDVNSRMLSHLAEDVPEGGRVLVNLPADSEYIQEIPMHLSYFHNRPDITVERFQFQFRSFSCSRSTLPVTE